MNSILVAVMVMAATSAQAQDKVIDFNQLPKAAQDFIKTYYDQNNVAYITEDSGFMSKDYEVRLTDGKEIEFDSKGNWTEVDGKRDAVPADIVLTEIQEYVSKRFPNNSIVHIKKTSREYEIELSNGLDLEFNTKGRFLRIDD